MALAAADVNGKWLGTFEVSIVGEEGAPRQFPGCIQMKQTGSEITGTAGPKEEEQWPISNGKIEGSHVTFDVQSGGPLWKFDLTLADGHLKGEATAAHEGRTAKAKIDVTKKNE